MGWGKCGGGGGRKQSPAPRLRAWLIDGDGWKRTRGEGCRGNGPGGGRWRNIERILFYFQPVLTLTGESFRLAVGGGADSVSLLAHDANRCVRACISDVVKTAPAETKTLSRSRQDRGI